MELNATTTRLRRALLLTLLPAALWASAALAGEGATPPDPIDNPMLITAGFLTHHPDMKYRMLGMKAYEQRRYADAMRLFRRASYFADKPSQGMVAEMYWNGHGVERDPALAYVWMDLAAERSYVGFLGLRERYWSALDAAQRERALREGAQVYARFGDAAAQVRYDHQLRIGRRTLTGSRTGFNRGVQLEVPGPRGNQTIEGSKFFDDRYWDAKKYWAWQDKVWKNPPIGRVEVGELEVVRDGAEVPDVDSRIPQTAPEVDAPIPDVPDEAAPEPAATR